MIGDSDLIDQDEKSGLDKVTADQENGMDADDGETPAQPLAEDSDSDDDGPVVISNRKKKHIAILDDSDEEEDDEPVVTETPITININEELGDSDKENAIPGMSRLCSQKDGVNKLKPPSRALPDDLFDAEMESDDDGPSKEKENNSDSGSDGSGSDDERPGSRRGSDRESGASDQEDEDTEVSAALRKRLAQGAGKKSKKSGSGSEGGGGKSKVHKPSKAEVEEMYSESQRMTRESRVKIPYHQPQKLGLSVFLARTQQKQEQLQTVKQPGLAWKHTPEIKPTENEKKCPLDTPLGMRLSSNYENKSADSEETRTDLPTSADDNNKVKQDAQDSENVENVKKSLNFTEEEDLDNLPDLVMDEEVTKVQYEVITSEEAKLLDTGGKEHDGEHNNKIAETSELVLDQKPEQESGYISVPTSEEENSGDHLKTDVELELRSSCTELAKSIEQEGQHLDSPVIVNNVKQSTFLTPKLATLSVNKFTPKLSGDPDSFIDLDDDDEPVSKTTPKVSADLEKLMERVIQHSAKRLPKAKDVEMSVVCKEKGPNQQEELKLHKLSYHIEAENHTPGAKLLQLKEALNEKIRQKRQEARQKRQEMCSLDDEEGYDDDGDDIMDEEAELTDQTDTDQEEEEEVDDEEELLGNNEEEEEVEERESNPFLDGEAEEDDEEMQNEDDLHLKLDSGEDESMQDTSGATETNVKSKDFLQSALKKTKTLDLFDEDANTESPTLSQNSTGCPPEISSRPFQQLSGSSDKTLVLEENNSPDLDVDILLDTQPVKNTSISMGGVSRDKDTSLMSDSSFEMYSTLIPAGQRTGQKQQQSERGDRETPDLFTPSSKSSLGITSTVNKNTSHLSDMALPVEDSQDLLVQSPVKASESGLKPMSNSLGFHFGIEESQSQLLDDDGLFKVRSEKKPARRQLLLDQSTRGSSTAEEELLGLCSGRFTEDSQQTDSRASKSLFGDNSQSTISSTNTNMDELLGLCSGRFTSQLLPSQAQDNAESIVGESQGSTQPGTRPFVVSTEDPEASPVKSSNQKKRKKKWRRAVLHDDDSNDSFEMVSDEGEEQGMENGKQSLDSDEEAVESGDEADQNSESDDEEMIQARQFKGFTQAKKHGKIRTEFVEEEAELSGSEYDSDENLDLAEKDDILEMEAGDLDDVGTEEELRNQVNRVHLKSMIDTDKKELRLMQEMYLQDGDMHSDGSGRQRNFRWRNIDADDDTQQDLFRSDDEDGEGEEGKEEQSWRVQRHEREKFLQEQKENEEDDTHNNSQLIKLGKVVFKPKKDANTPPVVNKEKDSIPEVPAPKLLLAKPTSATKENFTKPKAVQRSACNMFKLPHHGSFLRRSKDALAKIAEMSKPASTNIGGARNSGKFVFQALSADEKEKEQEQKEQKRPQVKRSMSSAEGANKRPRLEKSNTLPANSIFKLM